METLTLSVRVTGQGVDRWQVMQVAVSSCFLLGYLGWIDAFGTRYGSFHSLVLRIAPIHEPVASLIPFGEAVTVGAVTAHSDLAKFLPTNL